MKKIVLCSYLFSCILAWSDAPTPPPTNSSARGAAALQPPSEEKFQAMEIYELISLIAKYDIKRQAVWDALETEIEAYQIDFGAKPEGIKQLVGLRRLQLDVALIRTGVDPGFYVALEQKLLNDPIPEIVNVAKEHMAERKQSDEPIIARYRHIEDLKNKPLDLKFTAVDGSAIDLAQMRGKVVLIDFWATFCIPCCAEVPHVVAAYQKYHSQGFEVVGISLDKDKKALADFTRKNGMVWPQYFDDGLLWGNKISTDFGIKEIPAMWLVDQKGMLVTTNGRDDLAGQVEKLLQAGKTSAIPSTNTTAGN